MRTVDGDVCLLLRWLFFCPLYFFRFLSFLFACISHSVSSRQVYGSLRLLACSLSLCPVLSCCPAAVQFCLMPLSSAPLLPNKSPVKTARLQRNSIGGCGPNLLLPRPSCRPQSVFSIPLGCCSYSKLTSQQSSPCFQGLLTDWLIFFSGSLDTPIHCHNLSRNSSCSHSHTVELK